MRVLHAFIKRRVPAEPFGQIGLGLRDKARLTTEKFAFDPDEPLSPPLVIEGDFSDRLGFRHRI